MAYMCKIGAKECDGCGRCQNQGDDVKPLICEDCGCKIYVDDKFYNIDNNILCEDCGIEYFKENYRFTNNKDD